MVFTKYDNMVEAFSPGTADEPFTVAILPGAFVGGDNLVDSHTLYPVGKQAAIDAVAIADNILWCGVIGKRLNSLAACPVCSGMSGDIEVEHAAAVVAENYHNVENLKRYGRYGEKVDRSGVVHVVFDKGFPGL